MQCLSFRVRPAAVSGILSRPALLRPALFRGSKAVSPCHVERLGGFCPGLTVDGCRMLKTLSFAHVRSQWRQRQFMLTTSTPHKLTKDEVLAALVDILRNLKKPVDDAVRPSVAVLVTPSFATWLDDANFMSKVVGCFCKYGRNDHQIPLVISSLVAVVDGLPLPPGSASHVDACISGEDAGSDGQSDGPGKGLFTTEGFAFLHGDHKHILPGLWKSRNSEDMEKAAISFKVYEDKLDRHTLLPLANTLFRNGRPATSAVACWRRSPTSESFVKTHERQRSIQAIRNWPKIPSATQGDVDLPLTPLTEIRRVVSGLGNIVRQLTGADGQPQPASTELEAAVDAYLKARKILKQQVSVWALVMPASESTGDLSTTHTSQIQHLVAEDIKSTVRSSWTQDIGEAHVSNRIGIYLQEGAKLYRVLSGGGGWGVKAGLLSLDPQTSFNARNTARYDFQSFESISADSIKGALRNIANEGSYIQFWIFDEPTSLQSKTSDAGSSLDQPETFVIGCIPSTIDDIPSSETDEQGPTNLVVHMGHFGAQSEHGFYSRTRLADPHHVNTKINVPWGTMSWTARFKPGVMRPDDADYERPLVRKLWSKSVGGIPSEDDGNGADEPIVGGEVWEKWEKNMARSQTKKSS